MAKTVVKIKQEYEADPKSFFPITEAYRKIPNANTRQIRRWCTHGRLVDTHVATPQYRVYLETWNPGRGPMTNLAAYKRFTDRLNGVK